MPLRSSSNARRYRALTWLTTALFIAALVYQTLTNTRPATNGEAGSVLYGAWILGQPGPTSGAFGWTTGATLWPVIAATALRLDGLSLVRACASLCALIAFSAMVGAARDIFHDAAALWASVALALSGALTRLAQTATPRMLALAGVAVSLWAIARAIRRNNRGWLIVAGGAFAVALLTMYGAWICLIPLVAVMLALRKGRWKADLLVFGWTFVTALLIYITPESQLLLGTLRSVSSAAVRPFVTASMPDHASLEALALWYAPVVLVGLGGVALARGQRWLAATLLVGLTFGAAYDLFYPAQPSGQSFSLIGLGFGMPLCGLALARLWTAADWTRMRAVGALGARVSAALLVALMAAAGAVGTWRISPSQQMTSPVTAYAASHIRPGDRLLVTSLDPVLLTLYQRGNIRSLNDVYDPTRASDTRADLCAFDWVMITGAPAGRDPLQAQVEACGDYTRVYSDTGPTRTVALDGSTQTQELQDIVYVNVFTASHGAD